GAARGAGGGAGHRAAGGRLLLPHPGGGPGRAAGATPGGGAGRGPGRRAVPGRRGVLGRWGVPGRRAEGRGGRPVLTGPGRRCPAPVARGARTALAWATCRAPVP